MFLALLVVAALSSGDHRIALTHGGIERAYVVHVPRSAARPPPVISRISTVSAGMASMITGTA